MIVMGLHQKLTGMRREAYEIRQRDRQLSICKGDRDRCPHRNNLQGLCPLHEENSCLFRAIDDTNAAFSREYRDRNGFQAIKRW